MPLCVIINTIWRFVCDVAWLLKPKCSTFYLKDLLFISSLINREVLLYWSSSHCHGVRHATVHNQYHLEACVSCYMAFEAKMQHVFLLEGFQNLRFNGCHTQRVDRWVCNWTARDRQTNARLHRRMYNWTDTQTNLPHSFTDSVRALQDRGREDRETVISKSTRLLDSFLTFWVDLWGCEECVCMCEGVCACVRACMRVCMCVMWLRACRHVCICVNVDSWVYFTIYGVNYSSYHGNIPKN